jgi:hypothetical protein
MGAVRDIDRGWIGIKREMAKPVHALFVGIRGISVGDKGQSLAQIGSYHEFGGRPRSIGRMQKIKSASLNRKLSKSKFSRKAIQRSAKKSGRGNPPKRSFIGATMDIRKNQYMRLLGKFASLVVSLRATKESMFELLGQIVVSHIRSYIIAGIAPELAESTKAFKAKHGNAKNTPLIFHGRLLNSITYKIE